MDGTTWKADRWSACTDVWIWTSNRPTGPFYAWSRMHAGPPPPWSNQRPPPPGFPGSNAHGTNYGGPGGNAGASTGTGYVPVGGPPPPYGGPPGSIPPPNQHPPPAAVPTTGYNPGAQPPPVPPPHTGYRGPPPPPPGSTQPASSPPFYTQGQAPPTGPPPGTSGPPSYGQLPVDGKAAMPPPTYARPPLPGQTPPFTPGQQTQQQSAGPPYPPGAGPGMMYGQQWQSVPPPGPQVGPSYPQSTGPAPPASPAMGMPIPGSSYPGQGAEQVAADYTQVALSSTLGATYPPGAGAPPSSYGGGQQQAQEELPRPCGDTLEQCKSAMAKSTEVQGNCSPAAMRLSTHAFPRSSSVKRNWHLPFGAVVQPLAEDPDSESPVPVIGLTSAGIVRCRRCRTYVNPFMQFTDGGRRYRCNLCGLLNDVPVEYFCSLDEHGKRRDLVERPELTNGTVEFVAPQEYMVRPPMPPVYFFMLDVSASAKCSGVVRSTVSAIKASLDKLTGDGRARIGIMTFDETLHFYDLSGKKSIPQMFVVSDLEEPFLPVPDDLLVNLADAREQVDALLDSLCEMHGPESPMVGGQGSALGPALRAAYLVIGHVGGRLIVLQSSMPTLGNGTLKVREDTALYGTDREHTLRQPGSHFYKKFAAECSRVQISVDVIAAPPPSPPGGQTAGQTPQLDLPSLGALSEFTCGQLSYFPSFVEARDGASLRKTVKHSLCRPTAWEAVMRIRCSTGLKISAFHGHFFVRSSDLLALPAVDPDKTFSVEIVLDETVVSGQTAYMQCALLYTTSGGERRIRVHNLSAPVVDDLGSMYLAADEATCAALLAQTSAERSLSNRLSDARTVVVQRAGRTLREYRSLYGAALASSAQKLTLPNTLLNLPAYALGIVRGDALRGGARDVHPDVRAAARFALNAEPPNILLRRIWPAVYSLKKLSKDARSAEKDSLPRCLSVATVPTSQQELDPNEPYAFDDGTSIIVWVGSQVSRSDFDKFSAVAAVLDDAVGGDVDPYAAAMDACGQDVTVESYAWLVSKLAERRTAGLSCLRSFAVQQGTPSEVIMANKWMEDHLAASMSYKEFLVHLHRMSGGG